MAEIQEKKMCGIAVVSVVLGCLFIFPILGLLFSVLAIILGIIAFVKISNNYQTLKGRGLAIGGIVLGVIGIAIIPIAMLAAIALPNLLRARMHANDAAAQASVRTISTAIESWAAVNNGRYPSDEYSLRYADPPYLTRSYDNEVISGYNYSLDLTTEGYKITAVPSECGSTGSKIFTGETKGKFSEVDCK